MSFDLLIIRNNGHDWWGGLGVWSVLTHIFCPFAFLFNFHLFFDICSKFDGINRNAQFMLNERATLLSFIFFWKNLYKCFCWLHGYGFSPFFLHSTCLHCIKEFTNLPLPFHAEINQKRFWLWINNNKNVNFAIYLLATNSSVKHIYMTHTQANSL